ncbi:endolysin [Gordonia phage GMA6]|uniref:Putative lysin n=1 Tax=Gordonia phage GMA6 TaxID=1647285 RepID=A0A0K0NKS2_9CAUD|nr:endolysin [Gordonia phage GMA6]AKL88326.1 putative lysin [Gordonia phage GMA6]
MADRVGIDFSANEIDPAAIKAAGVEAVINYISEARPSAPWMKAVKPMKAEYAKRLRDAGIQIVSNYQYGKTGDATPSDWRGGYEAGKRHGAIALSNHWKAGGTPWRPCYAPCDDNPTMDEVTKYVLPFIKGWAEVWGKEYTGIYCNAQTWDWLKSLGAPVTWFWQHNWDGKAEHPHHPDAHMHQVRIDKDRVGGTGVDWNILLKADYGQWSLSKNPNPIEKFPIVDMIKTSGVGYNAGNSGRLRVYLHSSEGKDWVSTARGTMQYQATSQTGSYHYLIDDNEIIQTIALNNSAWAVLSDNDVSINICLVLSSGATGYGITARENQPKSRAQWLEHEKMLKMLRFLIDHVCRETGIPKTRVDIKGVGQNKRGVSSHNNYTYGSVVLKGFKDGTHWDIPDTFPYSYVLEGSVEPTKPIDPNAWPLPVGYYYGPLDGPEQSISGQFSGDLPEWKDGLGRWQTKVGITASKKWDAQTADAVAKLQKAKGWFTDSNKMKGLLAKGEWDSVITGGWKITDAKPEAPDPTKPFVPTPKPTGRFMPLVEGTYKIGSGYGPRDGGFHRGLDFEAKDGTPFYAMQAGTVLYIGPADGYGQWIVVDSDNAQGAGCVEYGHMWNAFATGLKIGSRVQAGQLLGYVGSNGESTGPHLHVAVHPYEYNPKVYVNPADWLRNAKKHVAPSGSDDNKEVPPVTNPEQPASERAVKVSDLTGDGLSDRFGMRATDLGAMIEAPNGKLVAVFGDTWKDRVGGIDWRAPVILIGSKGANGVIQWERAGGSDPNYARQLWAYTHDSPPWTKGGISTVLPSDLLRIGNTLYLHVMVNKGFPTVAWTEIWKSEDSGISWTHLGENSKLSGTAGNGLLQCLSWDYNADDDYVYAVSTGFQRDKGIVLRRFRPTQINNQSLWQVWNYNGTWGWRTNVNPSVITPSGEKWGELTLRKLANGWVLGGLSMHSLGLSYRVLSSPTANLYTTPAKRLIWGCEWPEEDHTVGKVAQTYGGYIVPGSKLGVDGGVDIVVSQWNTTVGWPYKVMQFRGTLPAVWPDVVRPDASAVLDAADNLTTAMDTYKGGVAATGPEARQIAVVNAELDKLEGIIR